MSTAWVLDPASPQRIVQRRAVMRLIATASAVATLATAACSPTPPPPASAPAPQAAPTAVSTAPRDSVVHMAPRATTIVALRLQIDSLLDDPRFHNAFWGVLIVDPTHGDTLYARNAHKLFLPASNMKVITSSVAMTQLGPDYRFTTTFATHGEIRHGTLVGDLVVTGRGDPSVSDHMMHDALAPLRGVADSLIARGIHRISGHIVAEGDAFPDADVGFGWDWDDLTQAYAAGIDELTFNEGFTNVTIRGSRHPGVAARIRTTPISDYPRIRSFVRSVVPGGGTPTVEPIITPDPTRGDLMLNGTVAPGDSTVLTVPYPNPVAAYLYALAEALRDGGVAVGARAVGVPIDVHGDPVRAAALHRDTRPAPLTTLVTLTSPPLRDILPALLKPSQNQIAEILLKTIGLERTGIGSADSGRRVVEAQLAAWGAQLDEFVIRDGSGLSRHDYLAPATLVRVLSIMQRDTAYHAFYDALPVAGVDGTIADRMRGTPAAGNVHAKTGFVDRARSLSGYVTTADGVGLIFSFLCNNWTVPVHDVEQVQDAIATRLASMSLGNP
jgi:D-alanyl-D-alanine carboxypeptidase/D-alanyl-D-alanine-endopeptidase (penicillin-binding protein 4)